MDIEIDDRGEDAVNAFCLKEGLILSNSRPKDGLLIYK